MAFKSGRKTLAAIFSGAALSAGGMSACSDAPKRPDIAARAGANLNMIAADFVTLALQFGKFDENYVDAFTGSKSVQDYADANPLTLGTLSEKADALAARLDRVSPGSVDRNRLNLIKGDVLAMQTRIAMAQGATFSFDEETRRLYGAVAPKYTLSQFEDALKTADAAGANPAPVIIPKDKVKPVMEAAIAECRRRTLVRYDLPETEKFDMEFVTDKPWSAYNWYKGDYRSVIQINLDQPMQMDRVLDLGCHEGYPGHHVFNVLAERDRIKSKGWIEGQVVPLYSPSGPLMEGSGNYGLELAFPGDEMQIFQRAVLYPLAGLTPDAPRAPDSQAVKDAKRVLDYAAIHAAREYLDGRMSREQAVAFMVKFNSYTESRAEQRIDFFDSYRGYIINYSLGQHVIGDYVGSRVAKGEDPWDVFKYILDTPLTLTDLQTDL